MFKGITKIGFEYEINKDTLDDWELFESLNDISNDNPLAIIDVAKKILGIDQYKKLKEFIREKEGKVSMTTMQDTIMEIFNANQEVKN